MNEQTESRTRENEVPERIVEQLHDLAGVDAIGNLCGSRFTIYCSVPVSITRPQLHECGLENPSIENVVAVCGDETNLTVSFESFWL